MISLGRTQLWAHRLATAGGQTSRCGKGPHGNPADGCPPRNDLIHVPTLFVWNRNAAARRRTTHLNSPITGETTMKSIPSICSTSLQVLLGAVAALWQSTNAFGGTPTDDAQAQARALLNPPVVHSSVGRVPDRLAEVNRRQDGADDAHRQAQRLLLGINSHSSEESAPSAPAPHRRLAAGATSDSPIGDAQEAARRMILGRDERVGRSTTTAQGLRVTTTAHLADQ